MAETPVYPVTTIAKLFDLTERRVQQLAKDNVIPKPVGGKYDLIGCVRGYVTFLRKSVEQQGSGSSNADLKQSRTDLLKMQQKNAELAYQQKTGAMIPIDVLQATVNEGTAIFVGQKRSMGSRLAGKLAGMTDPTKILKLLISENDKILAATSKKLHELSGRVVGKRRANRKPAAKPKSVRVGKRKQNPAAGKSGAGAVAK